MKVVEPPTVSKTWKIDLEGERASIGNGTYGLDIIYVEVTESVVSGVLGSEKLSILFYPVRDTNWPVRRSVPPLFGEPMSGVPKDLLAALRGLCEDSIFTRRENNPWAEVLTPAE